MTAAAYPLCSSPLQVGELTLKNRITRTAHGTGYTRDGKVTERLIAYHEARARGRIGSVILETTGVHPTSPGPLWGFADDVVPGLARLAERLHGHDVKALPQLWHAGGQTKGSGPPPWAASALPDPLFGRMSQAMTKAMIDEIVESFAAAAVRMEAAGLDGVEVHGGHGFLVSSFLSPLTNLREDEYGGPVENRVRFAREVLAAIRGSCGPGFAVGIRISATDAAEGGTEPEEAARIGELLERDGLIDFLDVSMGGYYDLSKLIGAMHEPHGYELPTSRVVTGRVSVPTIVAGRITSLAEAEAILADGTAEMVSIVRGLLADPELVRKSLAGEEDRVRPCIGCNEGCIGRRYSGGSASGQTGCAVNPDAGFEQREAPPRAASSRSVLVVGAGPAGLEAARTAAAAGHRVAIHEAADAPGGLVRYHRQAPYRHEFGNICDWLWDELGRLGVERRLSSVVTAETVAAAAPDAVVVATGALPRTDGRQRLRTRHQLAGRELAHVVTPLDVFRQRPRPARAVVLDDLGTYQAIGCAELLLEAGSEVVYVTSFAEFGPDLIRTYQRDAVARRLGAHRSFRLVTRGSLERITPTAVTLRSLAGGSEEDVVADLVVLVTGQDPQRTLYDDLLGAGVEAHLAGDAVAPLMLDRAIASGREAGLALAVSR